MKMKIFHYSRSLTLIIITLFHIHLFFFCTFTLLVVFFFTFFVLVLLFLLHSSDTEYADQFHTFDISLAHICIVILLGIPLKILVLSNLKWNHLLEYPHSVPVFTYLWHMWHLSLVIFCVLSGFCSRSDKFWAAINLSPDISMSLFMVLSLSLSIILIHFDGHFDCN